ncbi:ABC transporter permease [Renibacterium salmoninarum]|nr:FtsX-like permease family protein [Renibacterium salmoninarum]
MTGDVSKTRVVIGVVPNEYEQAQPMAYALPGIATEGTGDFSGMSLEVWVQPEQAQQLVQALRSDFAAIFPNVPADVRRSDYAAQGDPFASAQLLIAGIAALVMFLGVLSLLNITLVTIRYRVREIVIRRSFGATGGRVFFGVLMESVVATTVPGILGVMAAICLGEKSLDRIKDRTGNDRLPAIPGQRRFDWSRGRDSCWRRSRCLACPSCGAGQGD